MSAKPTYEELEQRIKELEGQRSGRLELDLAALFQGFEDSFPVGITDHKGVVLYVNNALVEMWGCSSPEELIGRQLAEFWEGPGIYRTMEGLATKGWSMGEDIGKRKDGSLFPVDYKAIMCTDFDGKPLYMLGQFVDITAKKNAEQALRKSEEKYRSLVENIPDVTWTTDQEGRTIFVSSNIEKVYGFTPEEIYQEDDKLFYGRIHPDDISNAKEAFESFFTRNMMFDVEYRIQRKDGQWIWVHDRAVATYEKDGVNYTDGILRDITHRKQAEEELLKAKKMDSVGILAGGIAHDFNNLLSIILGSLSIAKEDMKRGIDISGFLNKMEKASLQAKDLTHQLITFSTGGEPVKKETAAGRFLKESVLLTLSNTNIKCDFLISEDLWPVECDEAQMRQVFRNAVDNAVEAMKDDSVIEVRAENLTQTGESRSPEIPLQEGKYIKISIHDQGAGIAKEDLPKIFDPYFSTKERGVRKGMGLGLAAAYSIIKRHNGHIAVESHVNIGTTIHIYLPAISPKREEPGAERVQTDSQSSIVNSQYSIKKVLVMDDEELLRDLAKQMLPRIGYEVEVAWDGVEAIGLYKEAMASGKPFAMVILDLTNKGGMGGMETIKRLFQIDPHVRAIIASGYSNDPVMENFKQYGFCGALPKPYIMKQLEEVLDKVKG